MAEVKLRGVKKSFDEVEVIHGVDLEIKDREFVVFVGPSGCGKSTLLRMIAGLEDITEGEIYIGDTYVNDLHPADRGAAMVFQSYALYPHMSVRENIGFGLKLNKVPKAEIQHKVAEAAKILKIEELLDRRPAQLSGGQRQRVAIGRTIVREPSVFLFDEPLSNLDAALRHDTRVEIAKLHNQLDATTIYVTHDQVEAMTMADRIVVLNGGRVEQIGKPLELYNSPNNVFVAGFIGSPRINLLPLRDLIELRQNQHATISDSILELMEKENVHQLGFRPEMIRFNTEGIANFLTLDTEVSYMEQLGSEAYIYLEIENKLNLVMHNQGQEHFESKLKLPSCIDLGLCHFFDQNGKQISIENF